MERVLPQRADLEVRLARYAAPVAACALLVYWAVLMAAIHPSQFSDSIEQYNWAHSLEWGYWKHPPLSTWMMRGAIALLGVSHWTAPLLAAACFVATVAFMWRVACAILPPRAAQLAILLWPLNQVLTFRADVYNHNTVLLLFSSMIAWAALRAHASGRTRDWLLAGVVAGLGLLAKYQSLVTITGVLVALGIAGRLHSAALRKQLWLAAAAAFLVVLPHFAWLLREAFPTLGYVEDSAKHLHLFARLPALLRFSSLQVLMLAAMLLVAGAVTYWPSRAPLAPAEPRAADGDTRAWLIGLVAVPWAFVAAAVLLGGLSPQKMWGMHTVEFFPLWLAWRIDRARPGRPLVWRAAIAVAVLTVLNTGYALVEAKEPHMRARTHSNDRLMPADELARTALADWRRATACPLRLVTGTDFAGGLVSVYSGEWPAVIEEGDFTKTPWVKPEDLHAWGALQVYGPFTMDKIPPGVSYMIVPSSSKFDNAQQAIWWRVIRPESACG